MTMAGVREAWNFRLEHIADQRRMTVGAGKSDAIRQRTRRRSRRAGEPENQGRYRHALGGKKREMA